MKFLLDTDRKSSTFFGLAWLCAVIVVGCLLAAAGMGLGVLPKSALRLLGLVIVLGGTVAAGLMFLLEALAAKRSSDALLHAPEMSTLTFHPPAVELGRRQHLARVK
jgi:hypothetical protein